MPPDIQQKKVPHRPVSSPTRYRRASYRFPNAVTQNVEFFNAQMQQACNLWRKCHSKARLPLDPNSTSSWSSVILHPGTTRQVRKVRVLQRPQNRGIQAPLPQQGTPTPSCPIPTTCRWTSGQQSTCQWLKSCPTFPPVSSYACGCFVVLTPHSCPFSSELSPVASVT